LGTLAWRQVVLVREHPVEFLRASFAGEDLRVVVHREVIYSAVEKIEGVKDSLVVDLHRPDGSAIMPLCVVLEDGALKPERDPGRLRTAIGAVAPGAEAALGAG
jgi:hypothetical protein